MTNINNIRFYKLWFLNGAMNGIDYTINVFFYVLDVTFNFLDQ